MKLSHLPPLFRDKVRRHIARARQRWGRASAYRVGLAAAEDVEHGGNPYNTPIARRLWAQGVEDGRK